MQLSHPKETRQKSPSYLLYLNILAIQNAISYTQQDMQRFKFSPKLQQINKRENKRERIVVLDAHIVP